MTDSNLGTVKVQVPGPGATAAALAALLGLGTLAAPYFGRSQAGKRSRHALGEWIGRASGVSGAAKADRGSS